MASSGDQSYHITGKVCPPKLPMEIITTDNWHNIPSSLLESLFTEISVQGARKQVCALASQASVLLGRDGFSHSSVVGIPYFFCNFCDLHTDSKTVLLQHVASKHIFKCKICDVITLTRSDLIQHQIHKHLDHEEMQPVLGTKALQMNTVVLQRNLHHMSHNLQESEPASGRRDNADVSDFVSVPVSAQSSSSSVLESGDHSEQFHERKQCSSSDDLYSQVAVSDEVESPITSSRIIDLRTPPKLQRQCEHLNYNDKPSQSSSYQMPHFLDESDSSVTSSSTSFPRSGSCSKEEYMAQPNQNSSHEVANETGSSNQIPSFLTELLISPPPVKCMTSETDKGSAVISVSSSGYSKGVSPTSDSISEGATIGERDRSLSPNLSLLSGERLQKQLEEAVSKSPGFTFFDTGKEEQSRAVSARRSNEATSSSHLRHIASTLAHRMHEERLANRPEERETQDVDNFLMSRENPLTTNWEITDEKDSEVLPVELQSDQSRSNEGEGYDILRKLLIGKAIGKDAVPLSVSVPRTDNGGSRDSPGRHSSPIQDNATNCGVSSVNHSSAVTRASDMSLKDLLMQGLPFGNDPSSIFLVCGYCNFESSSKTQFTQHVEKCKRIYHGEETDKTDSCMDKSCGTIKTEPEDAACVVKMEPQDEEEEEEKGSHPVDQMLHSSLFKATEVLKGLSHHYKEGLKTSSNGVVPDQVHSSGNDLVISEAYSLPADHPFKVECASYSALEDENDPKCVKRQSKRRKTNNDTTYVLESDESEGSYSSDSDYMPGTSNSSKKRGRKIVKQRVIRKKEPSANEMSTVKRSNGHPFSKRQPDVHLTCLYCSFCTRDRADMRQHLIDSHSTCVPFAKALFKPKGKSLLYFCKGVHSRCTFFSSEGVEIMEHIKLCYAGHLDCFADSNSAQCGQYSQILHSMGVASKLIDHSPVTFYCLRCKYSKANFQPVAYHVSTNHPNDVAGILLVNKTFTEPRVHMVCLVCKGLVSVKDWVSHSCRDCSKVAAEATVSEETTSMLSDVPSYQVSVLTDSPGRDEPIKSLDGQNLDVPKLNGSSFTDGNEACSSDLRVRDSPQLPRKTELICDVNIRQGLTARQLKKEIEEEEVADDVPVHFVTNEALAVRDADNSEPGTDHLAGSTASSVSHSKIASNGSSVLQNLLTAPKEAEFSPKSFSLLHSLLRPALQVKEKGSGQLASAANKSQPLFSEPETHVSPQYPSIVKVLSHLGSASQLACTTSPQTGTHSGKMSKDIYEGQLETTSAVTSGSSQVSCDQDPPRVGNQHLSGLSVSMSQPSSQTQSQLSPPLIPHPPKLPHLPPLSPSPPTVPSAVTEDQGTPGPFTNLLRGLLTKSDTKSKP